MTDQTSPEGDAITLDQRVPSTAYRGLGLIGNPFVLSARNIDAFIDFEGRAMTNRLLKAIDEQADAGRPRTIWVNKGELPPSYALSAVGDVEHEIVSDDSLNLVSGYVQLAMMRMGRIRAILQIASESVAFSRVDRTIAAWVKQILAEPDTTLDAYLALEPDALTAFVRSFEDDSLAAVHRLFGEPLMERHMELTNVVDLRPVDLESEEIDESSDGTEIAPDFREARGVSDGAIDEWVESHPDKAEEVLPAADGEDPDNAVANDALFEYLFEYTREHLSPVVARALRAYRVRGVAVMATEFTITKAPRKTLGAVLRFARCRFRRVVVLFDGFDAWPLAEADLRAKIVGALSEVRSLLGDDLEMVFLVEHDLAPELEEQFGGGVRVEWLFENLDRYFEEPNVLDADIIDSWLASAALPGASPITVRDGVLARFFDAADGSLPRFGRAAEAALRDAAMRGVSELDETAERAGQDVLVESA